MRAGVQPILLRFVPRRVLLGHGTILTFPIKIAITSDSKDNVMHWRGYPGRLMAARAFLATEEASHDNLLRFQSGERTA